MEVPPSRHPVEGAGDMTDEELFAADAADERAAADGFDDVLTPEEKLQLDSALSLENSDDEPEKRQAWFGWSGRKNSKGEEVEKTKSRCCLSKSHVNLEETALGRAFYVCSQTG
ncbi:uncharacterized protein LOC144704741 [Wolffia australiana]